MALDSCTENRSILQPVPCHLTEGKEAVGNLLEVLETESFAVAVFSWSSISLPLELATELRGQQGKRLAILHLEGYRVRVLDVEDHNANFGEAGGLR